MNIKIILTIFTLTLLFSSHTFAGTLITSPIDSRPISTDYLGNLAALGGDSYIKLDNNTLDFFSIYDSLNHFGDSKATRENLHNLISEHNNDDTTVIINTSSYITGGLVGSRCGTNYLKYQSALEDLYKTITKNTEPRYYINVSMPRSLPETRLNQIWRDETPLKGISYYYVKCNPKCEDRLVINKTYSNVNATQFLMEYGYVKNKSGELGITALTPWEKDFLDNFERYYAKKEPYKLYLYKYKLSYTATANILAKLLKWQDEGLIDEIIISNDDLQLPASITYFYNNGATWVTTDNGTPIKYSYARSYMSTGLNSIYSQITAKYGAKAQADALLCKNDNINYVFGTDEIPQLIYARDLSKRNNLGANMKPTLSYQNKVVGAYDVVPINTLVTSDINFVNANNKTKTTGTLDLYVYDYSDTNESKISDFLKQMTTSYENNTSVGLIEIFSPQTLNTGSNDLFKTLLSNSKSDNELKITNLASYSAWNTNANAIGLGIAHSGVYLIATQTNNDPESFLQNQIKVLSQHIFEDGIFTIQIKRILGNEGFKPSMELDTSHSQKLYSLLQVDEITDAFLNTTYKYQDNDYAVSTFELSEYHFPWCRNFECYIDTKTTVTKD